MLSATERLLGITKARAEPKPKIALDTCCVQYYISSPPVQPWADCLDSVFQAGVEGHVELYVSTVVVSELLAHVYFSSRNMTGFDPELDLLAILDRHFRMLDVDGAVARAAGRLRGSYVPGDRIALKTPDALIGATSIAHGHTLFVTNDAQLADALPESSCLYLRHVALEWLASNFPSTCYDGSAPVLSSQCSAEPIPDETPRDEIPAHFIITGINSDKSATTESFLWPEGTGSSPEPKVILNKLRDHLEVAWDKKREQIRVNPQKRIRATIYASLVRERDRQREACYDSKSDHQKETDAWNNYLSPWRTLRPCLGLPQTTWQLCEERKTRTLDAPATARYLDRARNVLGWKDER